MDSDSEAQQSPPDRWDDQYRRAGEAELRVKQLESLLVHCWIHDGYPHNGRQQMTTEEKALYDEIISRSEQITENPGF